jgi:IclR family mhp operon transcriptional activator
MAPLNRSISRGLAVLKILSIQGPVTLATLASKTGLSKATLLRICATLEEDDWVTRRIGDGCFQIGPGFPQTSRPLDPLKQLIAIAGLKIAALSVETGLGVDLAGAVGSGRVEILDTTRMFQRHGIYPQCIGFRPSPFHSALGCAYLCGFEKQTRAQIVTDLSHRLSSDDLPRVRRLSDAIQEYDTVGYARRAPDHWGRAVDFGALPNAIAVPILQGVTPVGSLNLVWAANRYSLEDVVARHLARLQTTASDITHAFSLRA